uniref:PWWP domain-containing protein n=1 Tax=Gouania willdenowi TaxID=441366 RepID=A0A8C5DHH7_GOUWI
MSTEDRFKPGDLVFAKMKGFPHWPARIFKSRSGTRKRVLVYYFGTHQIVPPENVVPYVGNKQKYGSGVRLKGFAEGMWEIQNTPHQGRPRPPGHLTDRLQHPKPHRTDGL